MASVKLFLLMAIASLLSASVSAVSPSVLDALIPTVMSEHYNSAPIKDGYRFNVDLDNNNKREEVGVIMNPGTDKEELVVMGTYSTYDEKTQIESITMYTADKDGYKARYKIKNRKLSPGALKSAAG